MINCQQIEVRFGVQVALAGVDFACGRGEWVNVIGPSASGKTTLLRVIAGLQGLVGGKVRLGGKVASDRRIQMTPHARGIGFLFQGPTLWPHLDCRANVALGLSDAVKGWRARREAAHEWLDRVGVAEVARKSPGEISGGEGRRVALARALAAGPRILLLDEPTAHLDLHLREGLMERLRGLHAELGLTTVCVTHQIEPPMTGADRVVLLEGGRILFDGRLGRIAEAPRTDYTRALLRRGAMIENQLLADDPISEVKKVTWP